MASWQSPATYLDGVRIVASADAIALVRSLGGRLWVWPSRSAGCQPITMLHTSVAPVAGRTFHRGEFDPIELNLALASRWPQELELVERRGKVCGLVGRQQVGDLRALLLPSPEAGQRGPGRAGQAFTGDQVRPVSGGHAAPVARRTSRCRPRELDRLLAAA